MNLECEESILSVKRQKPSLPEFFHIGAIFLNKMPSHKKCRTSENTYGQIDQWIHSTRRSNTTTSCISL